MATPGELTMEQQFQLTVLKEQVKNLTLEQAQDYVVELIRQSMVKNNLTIHLMKMG